MAEAAGEENLFLFGLSAEEVADSRGWYNPQWHYENEPETRRALDLIFSDHFSRHEPGAFNPIREALLTHGDYYMHLADLKSYSETQERLGRLYADSQGWANKAILNGPTRPPRPSHPLRTRLLLTRHRPRSPLPSRPPPRTPPRPRRPRSSRPSRWSRSTRPSPRLARKPSTRLGPPHQPRPRQSHQPQRVTAAAALPRTSSPRRPRVRPPRLAASHPRP